MGSRVFATSLTPLCLQSLGSAPCPSGQRGPLLSCRPRLQHSSGMADASVMPTGESPGETRPHGGSGQGGSRHACEDALSDLRRQAGGTHVAVLLWPGNPGRCGMSRGTRPASGNEGVIAL